MSVITSVIGTAPPEFIADCGVLYFEPDLTGVGIKASLRLLSNYLYRLFPIIATEWRYSPAGTVKPCSYSKGYFCRQGQWQQYTDDFGDRAGIRLSAQTNNAQRDPCKLEVGLEMSQQIMMRQSGGWPSRKDCATSVIWLIRACRLVTAAPKSQRLQSISHVLAMSCRWVARQAVR